MFTLTLSTLSMATGKVFPTDPGSPSHRLVQAARTSDFAAVRRCFLDYDRDTLDLDAALYTAAKYSHPGIVAFLISFGATDVNSALLRSVTNDNVEVAKYLISQDRSNPASNVRMAQRLAADTGALSCDWLLTVHCWNQGSPPPL